jgi:S1-C subfamily serine protease
MEMDVVAFVRYIESNYLVGDRVTLNVLRYGKRLELTMTLLR